MKLRAHIDIEIRFSEVDALDIVWHGHYVQYLEAAREAFGRKYAIGYEVARQHGYMLPIVDMNIQYKKSLCYGDIVRIEARFVEVDAAKIVYDYRLYTTHDQKLVATARTVQVFIDAAHRQLQLQEPEYFRTWKETMLHPTLVEL